MVTSLDYFVFHFILFCFTLFFIYIIFLLFLFFIIFYCYFILFYSFNSFYIIFLKKLEALYTFICSCNLISHFFSCCAASVASEQQHKQDLRKNIEGETNSRIDHFLPECIAFNQTALRHF